MVDLKDLDDAKDRLIAAIDAIVPNQAGDAASISEAVDYLIQIRIAMHLLNNST